MSEPTARLYLICPPELEVAAFAPRLESALQTGDIACVLFAVRVGESGEGLASLIRQVQARDAAALILDGLDAVEQLDADGVHVTTIAALQQARRRLRRNRIVGAGSLPLRDDAMEAGEEEADYVMFGEDAGPFEERLARVAWWAEIFQVPCVAVAHALCEVEPFAEAGAEFVALGDIVWGDPRGPEAPIAEALRAVAAGHDAFRARQAEIA